MLADDPSVDGRWRSAGTQPPPFCHADRIGDRGVASGGAPGRCLAGSGHRVPARNALLADVTGPGTHGRAYGFERMMDNLGSRWSAARPRSHVGFRMPLVAFRTDEPATYPFEFGGSPPRVGRSCTLRRRMSCTRAVVNRQCGQRTIRRESMVSTTRRSIRSTSTRIRRRWRRAVTASGLIRAPSLLGDVVLTKCRGALIITPAYTPSDRSPPQRAVS